MSYPSSMGSVGMGSPWAVPAARRRPQSEQLQQRQQPRPYQQRQPLQNVGTDRSSRTLSLAADLPCKCGPKPRIASTNAQHQCCIATAQYRDSDEIGTNTLQYEKDEMSVKTSKRCAYSDNIVSSGHTISRFPISPSSDSHMKQNTAVNQLYPMRKPPVAQVQNLKLPESQQAQVDGTFQQTSAGCHKRCCGPSAVQQTQADETLLNNFEEVEQLILEESDDVQIALRLQNRNIAFSQNTEEVCQAEQNGFHSQKRKSSCQV